MNQELSQFAERLREMISHSGLISDQQFNSFALELFALQFKHNFAYCKICEARKLTPEIVGYWTQIPSVPTAAFKELELTSIPLEKRTAVFHSSGTTEQKPSRHFHCAESLAVYEASLWEGFRLHFDKTGDLIFLTPRPAVAPRSSLVHMFETIRQMTGQPETIFTGDISTDLS